MAVQKLCLAQDEVLKCWTEKCAQYLNSLKDICLLVNELQTQGFRLYLFGGSIQDILLFNKVKGDLDFLVIVEDEPTQHDKRFKTTVEKFVAQHNATVDICQREYLCISGLSLSIDICYPSNNLLEELRKVDFTVNTITFDCLNQCFFDPFKGLKDLENRTFHIHCPEYMILNPSNFPRVYRTAACLSFEIPEDIKEVLQKYMHFITAHNGTSVLRTFKELLRFFSLPSIGYYLQQMAQTNLLTLMFPELTLIENLDENVKVAISLDQLLCPVEWEIFLDSFFAKPITVRGYLRFVTLFGKGFKTNLISRIASRYKDVPIVVRLISEVLPLIEESIVCEKTDFNLLSINKKMSLILNQKHLLSQQTI